MIASRQRATLKSGRMSFTITQESLESITALQSNPDHGLEWSPLFILPVWLRVWWNEFKPSGNLLIRSIKEDGKTIGIAPLMAEGVTASFIGSADVCDYLDFPVMPGRETAFFNALLDDLKEEGITHLDLHSLRPDSTVLTSLVDLSRERGCEVEVRDEDVSVELKLPESWDGYLEMLNSKQRHEVRRKLRRLQEAGTVAYRVITEKSEASEAMDTFLKMFTESREDKAAFLTGQKESYFRALADATAEAGLLRMGVLDLDSKPVAMVLAFDFKEGMYLYNSGYDTDYTSLSVGLACKLYCIQESIEKKKKIYDFLKGNEVYKYRLGGQDIPLSACRIALK